MQYLDRLVDALRGCAEAPEAPERRGVPGSDNLCRLRYGPGIECPSERQNLRRFILERKIERFERALRDETDPAERRIISKLLDATRRELAELPADERPRPYVSSRQSPEE